MRITKSEISLELECWVEELSPAQIAAYEKVAEEHNAIKNALKTALNSNDGKELFNGQVFQAYSFKGKVLQDMKEATLPKKASKAPEVALKSEPTPKRGGRKRQSNYVYLESSDEEEDDVPLAKRIAVATGKKEKNTESITTKNRQKGSSISSTGEKNSPQTTSAKAGKISVKNEKDKVASKENASAPNFKPSEISSVGGLVIGNDKDNNESKENAKETKLQGKTFPSLVVLAKPWLKVKDMSATRSKLDSKVKLVLMLTPNKFTEWLIQEGLLKSEQKCSNHRNNELKLGVYSDASKFPYSGGYVWISECCPTRFVSVFNGSIFEGAPHPPSCILKLIYHWSCQTNIQNVVQWVKVDNVYIKGVYTWLRAVCTLAIHHKCKKLGGEGKYVEVGVISLGTTSQDGQQRQVKVEVLGVLDYTEKTIRLRAVEPVSDADRNYKKRFQTILEPLERWVHKESIISIDLTVDKMTLNSMGFKHIVQAAATDNTAKHTNSCVMDYLRRIVPRMFQNTLSLLSRQMIQQFLDELVWREQFGTYALQAFNNIATHIAEQTRITTNETLTQRLYQVATNPFRDWSVLPANFKETPANTTPKRLKKPINEADYAQTDKVSEKNIKKEKDTIKNDIPAVVTGKRGRPPAVINTEDDLKSEKKPAKSSTSDKAQKEEKNPKVVTTATSKTAAVSKTNIMPKVNIIKKPISADVKSIFKKEKDEDDLKGLEEMYYGFCKGKNINYESFPYQNTGSISNEVLELAAAVDCPICDINESYDSNEKLQTHLVSHISPDGRDYQFQCLFCLDKHNTENVLSKHNLTQHPTETKASASSSYHCLICQQRFNTLHYLTTHLYKHNMLELPYICQACGYRSSSHCDVVRHFYDDHKNHNFLQCPFCLDIFRFSYKGLVNASNIENYYMHLRQHISKKQNNLRCQKCALSFIDKGSLKQHIVNHHNSMLKNLSFVKPLLKNSLLITPPKVKSHHREPQPFTTLQKFSEYYSFIDGSICAECNTEILNEEHFGGVLKCNKCNYKSSCERAMYEHASDCANANGGRDVMELPLPNEMHCVCGFSTAIGNKMARHLANCGQKSAYPTVEMALNNTVKRNMLDMLGLVRRDGETISEEKPENEENADNADDNFLANSLNQQTNSDGNEDQAPIPFGVMEAAPVVDTTQSQLDQNYDQHNLVDSQQYQSIGYQPSLSAADIDMPLIGELADPNPPSTPTHFIGEVHTPMFDAMAAAEQQHYQQMMQQQPQ